LNLLALHARGRGLAGALALLVAVTAAAQPAAAPHATRAGQALADLEEQLLQAARATDPAQLGAMLDADFEMIVAQAPTAPVAREDWVGAMRKPGAADWTVQGLSARDLGDAAVAAFVLRAPHGKAAPLYVVDTWQRSAAGWRLVVRHVAPATGPRKGIPGDVQAPVVQKKY
jgi:hypothetical protein